MKLVDMQDLESCAVMRSSSSLDTPTIDKTKVGIRC